MLSGLALLLLSGLCQGTFGLGYKQYKPFSWEVFWLVYNVMCIATSVLFVFITAPKWYFAFFSIPAIYFLIPLLCGMMWGLSAIGFSKGISMIGMSMVYGLSMGISTVVGSVVPMWMNNSFPKGIAAFFLWCGLGFAILGVLIIAAAGIIREHSNNFSKIGITLSILSGLGSGAMNIGFNAFNVIKEQYKIIGYTRYYSVSAAQWLPILLGGCITGGVYCFISAFKKKSFSSFKKDGAIHRCIVLFCVSIVWYLALFLYGCAEKNLGEFGSGIGWILFNALSLAVSSAIGLKTGEWENKKARKYLLIGSGSLVLSWGMLVFV
ncbi:MAG: hypothetical protein N2171_02225 [Clostridia bacterium]|nr:hypothetical protein [Clostridia bacterium]